MRCGRLGTTAAVDKLQTCDCAAFVISAQDNLAKDAVAENARCQRTDTLPLLLELKRRLVFLKPGASAGFIYTRKQGRAVIKTLLNDMVEVVAGQRPDGGLRAARYVTICI